MPLFWADSIALCCNNVGIVKKWWIDSFDCKEAPLPAEWDCQLPSDAAIKLPGQKEPTILLSDWAEVRDAGYARSNGHAVVFCSKLAAAQQHLSGKGVVTGPIQDGGG